MHFIDQNNLLRKHKKLNFIFSLAKQVSFLWPAINVLFPADAMCNYQGRMLSITNGSFPIKINIQIGA